MATRPITDPFVLHACELLSCLGPCKATRMFGGYGLSVDGMNVAIIAWDTLFLKTNPETEPQWLAAGGQPFQYEAKGKTMRPHYHTPPEDALEVPALSPHRPAPVPHPARGWATPPRGRSGWGPPTPWRRTSQNAPARCRRRS